MAELTIIVGNKNYSSWSLRGWLPLRQTGADFEEVVVPLDRPETKESLLRHSPSARVPVLRHGDLTIWDSLAIGEYLAERFPAAGLWPAEPEARAIARAVTAEMHAGFYALRKYMPMDIRGSFPGRGRGPKVDRDIARIVALWEDCRASYGTGGEFLFGAPTLADAAFAPVVTRFATYEVALEGAAAAYRDTVLAWPALQEWSEAAREEPWVIEQPVL